MLSKKSSRDQRTAHQKERDAYTVVLENIRSDFKAFGEALKLNREQANRRFDRIEQRLKGLDRIESRVVSIEVRLDKIEARLDKIELRLTRIEQKDLAEIKTELQKIRQQLTQKVSHEEFQALERRVDILEQKIVAH